MTSLRHAGALTLLLAIGATTWAVAAPPPGGDVKGHTKDLKRALGAQDTDKIKDALEGLIADGGKDAAEQVLKLIPKLSRADDKVYWQLITGATGFGDQSALTEVGDFIVKKSKAPFARDLLFGLENNPSPHAAFALGKVLTDGPYDMQLMAADMLARIRTVPSVDALIAQLKAEGDQGDPELRRRLMTSLESLTGESMGDSLNWIGWWEANRDKGLPERAADNTSGNLASQVLDPNRKREFESLKRSPEHILVLSAQRPQDDPVNPGRDFNYDHMENVLSQMQVQHTVVLKADFEKDPDKYLKDAWTILINCNNVNEMCVCKECARINAQKQKLDPAGNRMFKCPDNCPQGHIMKSYRLEKETVEKIKKWVEDGGYLFTEDWGLIEIMDVAWPDKVRSGAASKKGKGSSTYKLIRALSDKSDPKSINQGGSMDVVITPGRGMTSHPLMRGVFARPRPPATDKDAPKGDGGTMVRPGGTDGSESPAAPPHHNWKIDDESPSITVVDRSNVTVLLESEELAKLSDGDEAVAVTFRDGNGGAAARPERDRPVTGGDVAGKSRGRGEFSERLRGGSVLHVLSHFGKQQHSQRDTFVLQNLILNFIMESNRQHLR